MSRASGIGKKWYDKFKKDLYPDDFTLFRGKKMAVPKYYDTKYEVEEPREFIKIKNKRIKSANDPKNREDNTRERRIVREKVQKRQAAKLVRRYESEKESI